MNKLTTAETFLVHYLAGCAILFGIMLLLLSTVMSQLSSIGWISIIFGAIWAVMDLTIFRNW